MTMLMVVMLVSCATTLGNTKFPEASQNYDPRKDWRFDMTKLFMLLNNNVLEENRASIASQDKSEGRITTDYIQGVTQMMALGILGTIQTRYKYNINLTKLSKSKTRINIHCILESTGNKMSAWRDISNDNLELVKNLENWLYEQIDTASRKA